MKNAKEELLNLLKGKSRIKCASITKGHDYDEDKRSINLKVNYSENEYNNFLKELDFVYDSGFGGQILFGIVWLEDDTWCTRGEYDGSEWWEHNQLPLIPAELLG